MITAQEIVDWVGYGQYGVIAVDDSHLALIVPAVNQYIEALPSIDRNADGTWAGTTKLGAVMLGARLYSRKNSPAGVEAAGEAGITYVARYDSDIARLLNMDSFRKPQVG